MNPPQHIQDAVIEYFRAYSWGFWRRGDGGEVYEWTNNGLTICYRQYLEQLLLESVSVGVPPLGTVLLVLAAAQDLDDNWDVENTFRTQLEIIDEWETQNTNFSIMTMYGQQALNMLNIIRSLPAKYRSLDKMRHLIWTLFDDDSYEFGPGGKEVIAEFASGRSDVLIEEATTKLEEQHLVPDLNSLAKAYSRFPDVDTLVTALDTGLVDVPDPAVLKNANQEKSEMISSLLGGLVKNREEKPIDLPKKGKGELIDELEEDNKTYGMAQLTRKLMAAIHIPLHSKGSSDLPFGGVSDITNRGDFDRLLLSELAYDDTTLMARLANNEALYLRREEPPQDLIEKRTILIDTTLKMWGIPRVYAISAALACTISDREGLTVSAYALGGEAVEALDLGRKPGVIEALGKLDAALHCGNALRNRAREETNASDQEVILITGVRQMQSAAFQSALAEVRERLDYLITVSREGHLQFFQYSGGRRKLLTQAMMNLKESLFAKRPRQRTRPEARKQNLSFDGRKPAFYQEPGFPMCCPTPGGRLDRKRTLALYGCGVLTVLPNQRVLFWTNHTGRAAREVSAYIEVGEYTFGYDRKGLLSILVSNKKKRILKLYTYDTSQSELREQDFSEEITNWYGLRFRNGYFIFDLPGQEAYRRDYIVVDPESLSVVNHRFTGDQISDLVYKGWTLENQMDNQQIKMHTNQGYSMVKKIKSVAVGTDGRLWVGIRVLNHQYQKGAKKSTLIWTEEPKEAGGVIYSDRVGKTESYDPDNREEYFRRHAWPDGSQAIGDTRGYLHLISSDPAVPHITLAMIVGVPTTAWVHGIGVTGNDIFCPYRVGRVQEEVYQSTIQAFIDVILARCS